MKRNRLLICAVLFIACAFPVLMASAGAEEKDAAPVFRLPSSLKIVEDEAFFNTSAETVIFPNGMSFVGEKALDMIPSLKDVFLPPTVGYIAPNVVPEDSNAVFHVVKDSISELWAQEYGHRYVYWENVAVPVGPSSQVFREDANKSRNAVFYIMAAILVFLFLPKKRSAFEDRGQERNISPENRAEFHEIDYFFP